MSCFTRSRAFNNRARAKHTRRVVSDRQSPARSGRYRLSSKAATSGDDASVSRARTLAHTQLLSRAMPRRRRAVSTLFIQTLVLVTSEVTFDIIDKPISTRSNGRIGIYISRLDDSDSVKMSIVAKDVSRARIAHTFVQFRNTLISKTDSFNYSFISEKFHRLCGYISPRHLILFRRLFDIYTP